MASTPSQSTPQTLEERITNRDSEDSEDSEDQDDHEYIEDSDDSDDNEDNEVQLQPTRPESDFNPAPRDVFIAQYILEGLRLQALPHLPPELSLRILSLAGYEPRIVRHRKATMRYTANDFLQPGGDYSVAALYLTTPPLPRSCRRAAWATIQMRSADQGWASFGGDGTYVNSHTWFEVSILRPLAGGTSLVEGPEHLESTLGQTFCIPEDAGETLQGQGWQMVDSNGRVTWLAHHNSKLTLGVGMFSILLYLPSIWGSCSQKTDCSSRTSRQTFMD